MDLGQDDEEEDDDEDEDEGLEDYPSDWETRSMTHDITLGTVATTNSADIAQIGTGTGRIVSFPNWIQVSSIGLIWATYYMVLIQIAPSTRYPA